MWLNSLLRSEAGFDSVRALRARTLIVPIFWEWCNSKKREGIWRLLLLYLVYPSFPSKSILKLNYSKSLMKYLSMKAFVFIVSNSLHFIAHTFWVPKDTKMGEKFDRKGLKSWNNTRFFNFIKPKLKKWKHKKPWNLKNHFFYLLFHESFL